MILIFQEKSKTDVAAGAAGAAGAASASTKDKKDDAKASGLEEIVTVQIFI